jgi:hypothetical protein
MDIVSKNRFGASPIFLTGAAIIFICLLGLGSLFVLSKLEDWHWLIAPGTADSVSRTMLPYIISSTGFAWVLIVLDGIFTGRLFWGRGTGVSDRQSGPIGFWLGICFQGGLSLFLIGLGIAMKLNHVLF